VNPEKYTIYADRKAGAPLLNELFIHIYEADFFRIKIHISRKHKSFNQINKQDIYHINFFSTKRKKQKHKTQLLTNMTLSYMKLI
jgi:hypothetical protein